MAGLFSLFFSGFQMLPTEVFMCLGFISCRPRLNTVSVLHVFRFSCVSLSDDFHILQCLFAESWAEAGFHLSQGNLWKLSYCDPFSPWK